MTPYEAVTMLLAEYKYKFSLICFSNRLISRVIHFHEVISSKMPIFLYLHACFCHCTGNFKSNLSCHNKSQSIVTASDYQSNVDAGDSKKLIWTNKIPKQYPLPIRSNICQVLRSLHKKIKKLRWQETGICLELTTELKLLLNTTIIVNVFEISWRFQ